MRSKTMGGKTYYQVVESYRDEGKVRHRTIYSLGQHSTRESAQAEWDDIAARDESPAEYRRRRDRAPRREPIYKRRLALDAYSKSNSAADYAAWMKLEESAKHRTKPAGCSANGSLRPTSSGWHRPTARLGSVAAAVKFIAREKGEAAVNAKSVAELLECSDAEAHLMLNDLVGAGHWSRIMSEARAVLPET